MHSCIATIPNSISTNKIRIAFVFFFLRSGHHFGSIKQLEGYFNIASATSTNTHTQTHTQVWAPRRAHADRNAWRVIVLSSNEAIRNGNISFRMVYIFRVNWQNPMNKSLRERGQTVMSSFIIFRCFFLILRLSFVDDENEQHLLPWAGEFDTDSTRFARKVSIKRCSGLPKNRRKKSI